MTVAAHGAHSGGAAQINDGIVRCVSALEEGCLHIREKAVGWVKRSGPTVVRTGF